MSVIDGHRRLMREQRRQYILKSRIAAWWAAAHPTEPVYQISATDAMRLQAALGRPSGNSLN